MDLIANLNPSSSAQWVFIAFVLVLTYIAFLKFRYSNQFLHIFWIGLFFILKYFFLFFLGFIFEKNYLFEEVIFQSFLYEKVIGVVLFPLTLILFYGPFQAQIIYEIIIVFLVIVLVYKWLRMLYLSFFNSSLPKAHIIIYLCTFEILPLIIITKRLC